LQLFRAPAATFGGPFLGYTVPGGLVAVVECISFVWGDVVITGIDAWVQTQDLTKLVRTTLPQPSLDTELAGGCAVFTGRWLLNPGDQLFYQVNAGTCDIYATGYTLTLP